MSIPKHLSYGKSPTERLDENTKRRSILGKLCGVLAVGEHGSGEREVAGYLVRHESFLTDKGARGRAAPIDTLSTEKAATVTPAFGVTFGEPSHSAGQIFVSNIHCRRWFVAIATTITAISLQGGAPALSKNYPSSSAIAITSIRQSEASSITAHGGGTTLQDCMTLWDAATHMSKQEWKAACKRAMVVEFPDTSP